MTVAAVGAADAAGAAAGADAGAAGAGATGARAGGAAAKSSGGGTAANAASGSLGEMFGSRKSKSSGGSSSRPGSSRRLLVAEFMVCMVVLAFSPLTGKSPSAAAWMKRGSAIIGLFFVLGLISTGGRGASKAAAGFGGLITLVLLVSDRSIFVALTKKFGAGVGEDSTDLGGLDAQDALDQEGGAVVGDALGDAGGPGLSVPDPGTRPTPDGAGGIYRLPPLGPLGNGIR